MKIEQFLSDEAKSCDYLILWLDCDMEGENICTEVMDAVMLSMLESKPLGTNFEDLVFRANFSSHKEVVDAIYRLTTYNLNKINCVEVRSEIDLRVGLAFSKYQTEQLRLVFRDKYITKVTYGLCQTPALRLIVDRTGQGKPFWVLEGEILYQNQLIQVVSDKFYNEAAAEKILDKIQTTSESYKIKRVKTMPIQTESQPIAMHTFELMRAGSKELYLHPWETMNAAQKLYTQGYISYPRTETSDYPEPFDYKECLNVIDPKKVEHWSDGECSVETIHKNHKKPLKGASRGDHPPIMPIKSLDGNLQKTEKDIYNLVCKHFLATIMPPCKFKMMNIEIKVADEEISFQIKLVKEYGYTIFQQDNKNMAPIGLDIKENEFLTFQLTCNELSSPTFRKSMEQELNKIVSGEADPDEVREQLLERYSQAFKKFTKKFPIVKQIFADKDVQEFFPIRRVPKKNQGRIFRRKNF
uniref:DNA topoisomerase n=1 Tax=Acrobeloides nanus TaxID=290746 RepID=A0A914DCX4_9BILA